MDGGAWKLVDLGSSNGTFMLRYDFERIDEANSPTGRSSRSAMPGSCSSLGFVGASHSWPTQFAGQERGRVKLNFRRLWLSTSTFLYRQQPGSPSCPKNCCLDHITREEAAARSSLLEAARLHGKRLLDRSCLELVFLQVGML